MEERRTGRTSMLLAATPPGGYFIVHSAMMRGYIESWLRECGRENDNITVLTVKQAVNSLRGRKVCVTLDHLFYDDCGSDLINPADREFIVDYCAYRAPLVVYIKDGYIRTNWRQL